MLGIIIGVASVIMLTSIGEGVKREITSQVESLGTNLIFVLPGKINMASKNGRESKLGVRTGDFGMGKSTLTYEDVTSIKGKPDILGATGIYNGIDRLDSLNIMVSVTGVDEDFPNLRKLDIAYGRFIIKEECVKRERVAVIGHQANKEIFNGQNSIGRSFKLNGKDYKVIGILAYKKPENMGPQSEDLNVVIYLPITELVSRVKNKNLSQIIANAASSQAIPSVEKTIKDIMIKRHKEEEFSVIKQQEMVNTINRILNTLNAAIGGIAAISLIVGGIGIMNIMLVSVVERTHEIGIRKAIGARRADILSQFLVEAVVMSLTGAVIGLAIGTGLSRWLHAIFPIIPTVISIPALIISISFAIVIGVFFGVYPATKAAGLDPIEALRNE
jgi:putative ABC transport system permease protein